MNIPGTRAFHQRWFALMLSLLALTAFSGRAGDLKFEAQLIWAANDEKPPNPKLKEAEPEIRKKLGDLPLKWKKYFEINRKQFNVPKKGSSKVSMSDKCAIEVEHLGGDKVEVSLISKKKSEVVLRRTQQLPKGEILVLGGNAPNATAWLTTLKRVE
jgi:hypothetical protein